MPTIEVRFFAGAAEAFGTDQLSLELPSPATLGMLLGALRTPGVAPNATADSGTVLSRCSYLVNKVSAKDASTPLTDGIRVDVLPPFAGG